MAMTSDAQERERHADALAAAGNLADARKVLEALVATDPDAGRWLKLGSLCRATGDLQDALTAVERSLSLAPLDFMALMSRASILERLGRAEAGEAYGNALAQRPKLLEGQLARMVDHAEQVSAAYTTKREEAMKAAQAAALAVADEEEAIRINRFRDNALRRTRVWHSAPTHFHFPGLIEREFHDRSAHGWLLELEAAFPDILAEFQTVVSAERAELLPYVQYSEHEPLDQWRHLNHSLDWTAIHLWQYGRRVDANARHCPRTMALLETLPQPHIAGCSPNAMFSLLAPGAIIPPHVGVSNTRLVCHLPLVVPEGCWFRVGAETRFWEAGKAFVFDDTIEHEAANPSTELRVVFIIDIWHPGLSAVERDAVRLLLEADADSSVQGL